MSTSDPAHAELIAVRSSGSLVGLGNLTRKEFNQWWNTRLWWIQTLIWMVILNGVSTIVMLDSAGMTPAEVTDEAIQTFFLVGATAIPIGIVISLQGAIVGERELGTAAWVLSKPVSRASFLLSKLLAHVVGFAVTALLIPATLFLTAARLILPERIQLGVFGIGLGIMGLLVVFYVVLTLSLGCFAEGRGPVAGAGITLVLTGQLLKGTLPLSVVMATPWLLGDTAASFPMQVRPEFARNVPLIVVAIGTVVFGCLALRRFDREEF